MKRFLLLAGISCIISLSHAQLLKKFKEKVNKTIGKDDDKKTDSNTASGENKTGKNTTAWCDTIKVDGIGADGVAYTKIYSSPNAADIVYTESSLGLNNDPSGYRLILTRRVNNKEEFVVVENGKEIDAGPKEKDQYLGKGMQSSSSESVSDEDVKKYVVADSTSLTLPKSAAKNVTVEKVDDDQADMAINIIKQTDEYKKMTPEQQKELEKSMQAGIAQHNSMAGKNIAIPGQKGGSFSTVSGYKLVVKDKTYGKFMMAPAVGVSGDELSFVAVGMDEKGAPVMITQSKKTTLPKAKFSGNSGRVLKSADHKKMIYIEPKQMNEKEMQELSAGKLTMSYNALRADGTGFLLNDAGSSGKFRLTNAGSIINVNENSGELYSDNKKIGKFNVPGGGQVETDAIMIGGTNENIAYYDGNTGSLIYLDGNVKKLGIMFPSVTAQNGKTYLSWFRKCRNDFYIGRFSY